MLKRCTIQKHHQNWFFLSSAKQEKLVLIQFFLKQCEKTRSTHTTLKHLPLPHKHARSHSQFFGAIFMTTARRGTKTRGPRYSPIVPPNWRELTRYTTVMLWKNAKADSKKAVDARASVRILAGDHWRNSETQILRSRWARGGGREGRERVPTRRRRTYRTAQCLVASRSILRKAKNGIEWGARVGPVDFMTFHNLWSWSFFIYN